MLLFRHQPRTATDLPVELIQYDPRPYDPHADDAPPPAKPVGWRTHNVVWKAPRHTDLDVQPRDLELLAALTRCYIAPLEILQPLALPDRPLKSLQQRIDDLHHRGLIIVGHTRNDTGKPRRKLLAASRTARDAVKDTELRPGTPIVPAASAAFRRPHDPAGGHLVRHLQNLTAIAGLALARPSAVLDWHAIHPTTRQRDPLRPIGRLTVDAGPCGPVDVTAIRIDHPWHQRPALRAIRRRFSMTEASPPVVLILTPTITTARRILTLADDALTIADRHEQPARERTLVMPLNQIHLRRRMVLRVNPAPPQRRSEHDPTTQDFSFLPTPHDELQRELRQSVWDDSHIGDQLEFWD